MIASQPPVNEEERREEPSFEGEEESPSDKFKRLIDSIIIAEFWYDDEDREFKLGALRKAADILDEASDAGTPVDLNEKGYYSSEKTLLNEMLWQIVSSNLHGISAESPSTHVLQLSASFLARIFNHVNDDWQAHHNWIEEDEEWCTPLYYITCHDNEWKGFPLSKALLPLLIEKCYPLPDFEREIIPDEVLKVWDAMKRKIEVDNMLFSFNRANQQGPLQENEQSLEGPPAVVRNIHIDITRYIAGFL